MLRLSPVWCRRAVPGGADRVSGTERAIPELDLPRRPIYMVKERILDEMIATLKFVDAVLADHGISYWGSAREHSSAQCDMAGSSPGTTRSTSTSASTTTSASARHRYGADAFTSVPAGGTPRFPWLDNHYFDNVAFRLGLIPG